MRRHLHRACLFAALTACSSQKSDDGNFAALLHSKREEAPPIRVDAAAKSPEEAARALAMPHRRVGALLGAHRYAGSSSVEISEGDKVVEVLKDETRIELDAAGRYRATLENSREYGRHALFIDGTLYLRPRYGAYHKRAPADKDEPARIRDQIYGTLAAYAEPLMPALAVADGGAQTVAGRPARKIVLSMAPKSKPLRAETLLQRKWRQQAEVTDLGGEIFLDAETGVPLQADIRGAVAFKRDDRQFVMKLVATQTLSDFGQVAELSAPPANETVLTPTQSSEVAERDELLKGIAPPTRRTRVPDNQTQPSEVPPQ